MNLHLLERNLNYDWRLRNRLGKDHAFGISTFWGIHGTDKLPKHGLPRILLNKDRAQELGLYDEYMERYGNKREKLEKIALRDAERRRRQTR